jgi:hypothetical protein
MEGAPQPIDFDKWLEGAKAALLPPVCNKLIYGGFVAPPPVIFHLQSFFLLIFFHCAAWATLAGS